MNELDKLLEDRANREKTLQDMITEEDSLKKSLNEVNEALDVQTAELHKLTETMRTNRLEMQARIQEKKERLVELKEDLSSVEKEEQQNASYRAVANKSRYLRRRISQQKDEKKILEKKVNDLCKMKEMVDIRRKMMVEEKRTLWLKISEKVQWMAENGEQLDVGRPAEVSLKEVFVLESFHGKLSERISAIEPSYMYNGRQRRPIPSRRNVNTRLRKYSKNHD